MARLNCTCGGEIRTEVIPEFDFGGYAGLPVVVHDVAAMVCASCGGQTLESALVERILYNIERDIMLSGKLLSGPEIRFLRKRCDWTQQEFADHLKVSRGTVADWERGADAISSHSDHAVRYIVVGRRRLGSAAAGVDLMAENMPTEEYLQRFLAEFGYLRDTPAMPPAFVVDKLATVSRRAQGGKRG
jgi:DNA-binding transcriptional regulator YiaG